MSATPAKEVTGAQDEKTTAAVQEVVKAAGLITETKETPKPVKVLTLAEREKAIRENAERLKGLTTLRAELDNLRAWGFADNGNNATLKITGDEVFTTSNTRLISKLKNTLEDLFEERIAELETEIQNATI